MMLKTREVNPDMPSVLMQYAIYTFGNSKVGIDLMSSVNRTSSTSKRL